MKRILAFYLVALVTSLASAAEAAHTRASLLLPVTAARAGDTVLAAVRLQMDPGWHTYWRNGGDSGGPTRIEWELPAGVTAGEVRWPAPEKYTVEGTTTYIYHDDALLFVPLTLAANLQPGPLELKAKVSWLECEKLCVPGDEQVAAKLLVASSTQPSPEAALLETARAGLPGDAQSLKARAAWEPSPSDKSRHVVLEWDTPAQSDGADFYPDASDNFTISTTAETLAAPPGLTKLRIAVTTVGGAWPTNLSGLLINKAGDQVKAFEANIAIAGTAAPTAATKTSQSLGLMLLYAFIGGLILNIMPCVLPVIALKILGFVNQARESPARVRMLGLVYAAGVLVSFLVLAGLVIGLKTAGQAAGWGMQFSSPQFTIAFSVLVTLVALNLFGVFEVTLGGGVLGAAGELASRHGTSGAFFNGVLATVLATPCTAPFLSVALGFAFSQSAAVVALTFLTVGAGLASPYVVLSWFPAWLKWLPKPGAWMQHFKVAMGFPMLATAIWLASLVSDKYGERAWWLGILLLFIGIAAWVFGEFIQRGQNARGIAAAILTGILAVAYLWILEGRLDWRHPLDPTQAAGTALKNSPKGYAWQRWSADAVNQARAEGRAVIIDFTAKWCITCDTIVKSALQRPAVIDQLLRGNVAAFVADYTDYGPDIAAEMKRHGRAAVPLVLVFPASSSSPPIILPDPNPLLGPGHYADLVIEALRGATK